MKKLPSLISGACLLGLICATPVHALTDDDIFKVDEYGLFTFRYLTEDAATRKNEGNPVSNFSQDPNDLYSKVKPRITSGLDYWNIMLAPYAAAKGDIDVVLIGDKDENASASSDPMMDKDSPLAGQSQLTAALNGWESDSEWGVAHVTVNDTLTEYFSGHMEALPQNGDNGDLASTILHEIAHALGISTSLDESDEEKPAFALDNKGTLAAFSQDHNLWNAGLRDIEGKAAKPGMAIIPVDEVDAYLAFDKEETRDNVFITMDKERGFGTTPEGIFVALGRGRGGVGFTGEHVAEVLNGAQLTFYDFDPEKDDPRLKLAPNLLPINGWENDDDPDNPGSYVLNPELSHIELQNGLMSHQSYRNWNTLMEAELAVMQDLGVKLDRRDWYGYSIYHSGTEDAPYEFVNDNPYYARENGEWIEGQASGTPWGMGLHIYGSHTEVTQAADILTVGEFGTGIRIDGVGNSLDIAPDVRVHADGYKGTGLMVAYGKDHNINLRGDVQALGDGGIGARFDFGSNKLGDKSEYRGSWIRTVGKGSVEENTQELTDALKGSLVNSFNVSGRLAGEKAAIYISENAHVGEINILNGAQLEGDIISDWALANPRIDYPGDKSDLLTTLAFGLKADENGFATKESADPSFSMYYVGNISGDKSLDVKLAGGTLSINGNVDVHTFTVEEGATLKGSATYKVNDIIYVNSDDDSNTEITLAGTFINKGTIAPGNSIGTITIKGDYLEKDGGRVEIEFDADDNHDVFKVTGDVGSDITVEVDPESDFYGDGEKIEIDLADALKIEAPTFSFADVKVLTEVDLDSVTLDMDVKQNGSSVTITASRAHDAYSQHGHSANAAAVGRALDHADANPGGMEDVFAGLDFSKTSAAVDAGLDQLSPSAYGNAAKVMLDGQRLYSDLILSTKAPEGDGMWHAFAQPFGGFTDQPGESGWEAGRGGIIAGFERSDADSSVGVHMVFDHVSMNGDVNGRLRGEGLFLGMHGRWAPVSWNGFHAYALGRIGFESMEMDRHFSFGPYSAKADSDWTGTAGSLRVGGGWNADLGSFTFGPIAELDYAFNARPSVDEHGASAAMRIGSEIFQSLRSGLGLRASTKAAPLANGLTWAAQASVVWHHELMDKAGSFDSSFRHASNSSFSHDAEWEGRDSLGISAGVSIDKGTGFSFSVHGGSELFRHKGSSFWGKASLNWKF